MNKIESIQKTELCNFWECPITYDGLTFGSSEAAYQAAKSTDYTIRKLFTKLKPNKSKSQGKTINLRSDWEAIKLDVMYQILLCKFLQNPELVQNLLDTGTAEIEEGNHWKDTFWGICDGKGENHLGKILMRVREQLRGIR